jgi:hypothetical protein
MFKILLKYFACSRAYLQYLLTATYNVEVTKLKENIALLSKVESNTLKD